MAAKVGMLNAILSANTSGFKAGMTEASASAAKFAGSIKAQNRQLKKFGKQLTKTGKTLSLSLSLPLAALGALATKTFVGFEAEMAKVQAVSGATGKTFSDLRQLAEDLGASTRFTASQVATLQLNYSKLGFVPAQIQKITASTLDLALATGEDLAASAEVAGATLRGFGLTAEQMPKVIDVMALSFSSSALTLEKFKDSMKAVAPVARAVGATLEDTTAVLSTLVDSGLEASTAGTSLRMIFIRLAKNGISWKDAMGKIRSSTNKLKTATELFGDRAAAAGLIISENEEKITNLTKSYEDSGGAAKRMAAIMDDTLEGAFLKVKSAVEAVGIEFGRRLAPILTVIAEKAVALAGWFQALEPATKDIVLVIGALAVAVGPLLIAFGFLASTILPALLTGFALLTGPIGLAVLAIGALIAGYIALTSASEDATREMSLQEKVLKRVDGASENLNKKLKDEKGHIDNIFKALKDENISRGLKKTLTEDLNREYGKYLPHLLDENSSLIDIKKAEDAVNDSMRERLALMLGQEELVAVIKEFRQEEEKLSKILEKAGFSAQQVQILKDGAESLEDLAKATRGSGVDFVDFDGELISVSNTVKNLTGLQRKQKKAVRDVTKAYKDLISIQTAGAGAGAAGGGVITPVIDTTKMKAGFMEFRLEFEENIESAEIAMLRFNDTIANAAEQSAQELEDAWGNSMRKIESITRDVASAIGQVWGSLSNVFSQAMRNDEIALENKHSKEIAIFEDAAVQAEEEQLRLDDNFARQTERIENSILSQEEKDAKLLGLKNTFNNSSFNLDKSITKKRQLLDEKIEKEKKKLAKKRAETEKASAIIGAIVNTALAVTGALAAIPGPGGILLAAVVGLLGAAEIALIEGQPIAMAKGGIVTSPTLALIGEAGPEMVLPLSGNMDFLSSGNQDKELITRITADEIHLVLKRRDRNLSFT